MLNKYTYSLFQVEEILDLHIENDSNFLFVCDFALAHYIYDYLRNEYDIEAESLELSSDVNEYYLSMSFYKDGSIKFFCEFAKWDQEGKYKYDECDYVDYYIFTGMSFSDAREFLYSKGEMKFCELVDELVVEEPQPKIEFTEEDKQDIAFVEQFAYAIENIKESGCTCGGALRNILYDFLCTAREIGYADAVRDIEDENDEEMTELEELEVCSEPQIIAINIDSLTINDATNSKDLIEQLQKFAKIRSGQCFV